MCAQNSYHFELNHSIFYTTLGSEPNQDLEKNGIYDSKALGGICRRIVREIFWLSDDAWAAIEPHLPKNRPGPKRADDRLIISGIIHVIKSGCRWRDCPSEYGPPTTVYNRFNRWSYKDHWKKILKALAEGNWITAAVAMDGSYIKAHRSAFGGKGGLKSKG